MVFILVSQVESVGRRAALRSDERHHGGDESGGGRHGGAARGGDAAAVRPTGQSGAVPKKRSPQEGVGGGQAEGDGHQSAPHPVHSSAEEVQVLVFFLLIPRLSRVCLGCTTSFSSNQMSFFIMVFSQYDIGLYRTFLPPPPTFCLRLCWFGLSAGLLENV